MRGEITSPLDDLSASLENLPVSHFATASQQRKGGA
jgi:hypothetical protein